MAKHQPKPKVYSRIASKGEPFEKSKTSGSFTKIPNIQEDPLHEGEEQEVGQPKYPPASSTLVVTAATISTIVSPLPTSQEMVATSLSMVDISTHLASTLPVMQVLVIDSFSTTIFLLSSSSMSSSSYLPQVTTTIPMPTLSLLKYFARNMQNMPMELSGVLLNPTMQATLAHVVVGLLSLRLQLNNQK